MTNKINFDKSRYLELLKKEEFLKNKGTCLFYENREENLELLSYSIILENQIYYNRKAAYISLVEQYLEADQGEDGARLFVWEFYQIFEKDHEALTILEKEFLQHGIQKLATFRIDPKSTEFAAVINEIVGSCEFLTFDPEDSYGMTVDQFRDSIQKFYLKIQKNNQE